MNTPSSYADVSFPLRGSSIPLDHGYPLYGALSRQLPILHKSPHWFVHPVQGTRQKRGVLALDKRSRVKIRLPSDEIGQIISLAQKTIDIKGNSCQLGFPKIFPLITTPHLKSRLVIINVRDPETGKLQRGDPESFAIALRGQIASLPGLGQDPESIETQLGNRRVLRIKGTTIIGFPVALTGLDADASLAVQIHGLGGRHHMGAGVFVPPPRSA